jgi:hypothetical protein
MASQSWREVFSATNLLKRFTREKPVTLGHITQEEDPNDIRVRRERGVAGNEVWGGSIIWKDYNPLMTGPSFFDTVDKMRKGDGSVAAVMKLIKLPFLRTTWNIVPANPTTTDNQDKLIADTCHAKLIDMDAMHNTWDERLRDILLMFDYGFTVQEKVFDVDDDGFLRISKLGLRMARTISDFEVNFDGSIKNVVQDAYKDGRQQTLRIPGYAACVYSWEKEGDNYWGQSVLRPIYKHWFYKEELYRIDAVRLDRWGIGIPHGEIKEGKTLKPNERTNLETLLKGLRGNERAFFINPEEVQVKILGSDTKASDLGLMTSVEHHDVMQFRSVLAQFITTGNQSHGNYGSTRSYADMFLFAMQAAANFIQEQFTKQVIRQFCDLNFNMNGRPSPVLRAADIQKIEIGLLSESLNRLAQAKIITPDDDLESFFRKMYGWPALPTELTRMAGMARGIDPLAPKAPAAENPEGRPPEGDPKPRKVDTGE